MRRKTPCYPVLDRICTERTTHCPHLVQCCLHHCAVMEKSGHFSGADEDDIQNSNDPL